ncbi:hypothetical protein RJ639_025900 [Escallonia herrerae]|uniref:Cancer-related nucleoside-triphosphatase n=1 Tax=Escallonia herrerae TaxID=1293975 RepID=A0AA88UX86_9ASTE|nr:hypothetical protein RJ639_025900 [Escallonia herrerae]
MAAPGKCFLVTGPPGVGKTTLVMRVFETLKNANPNFNVQGEGTERVGFDVVTLDGRTGPLASTKISSILLVIFAVVIWMMVVVNMAIAFEAVNSPRPMQKVKALAGWANA